MPKSNPADSNREGLARRMFKRLGWRDRAAGDSQPGAAEIEGWLIQRLAEELELEQEEIDVSVPVDRYGLDSRTAASLSGELEDWLGRRVAPTLLWEHPTIEALARHLTRTSSAEEPASTGPAA